MSAEHIISIGTTAFIIAAVFLYILIALDATR